jgi:hypothetical protein
MGITLLFCTQGWVSCTTTNNKIIVFSIIAATMEGKQNKEWDNSRGGRSLIRPSNPFDTHGGWSKEGEDHRQTDQRTYVRSRRNPAPLARPIHLHSRRGLCCPCKRTTESVAGVYMLTVYSYVANITQFLDPSWGSRFFSHGYTGF